MKKRRSSGRTPPLGQHFLRGVWAARVLAEAANISKGETVLEIGPGTGVLTKELLHSGARVIAIEKDRTLVVQLQETFSKEIEAGLLSIISADIRDISLKELDVKNGEYVLAANIPYYITGEILRMFLSDKVQPKTIALLMQKEVAQRIVSDKESILSLSVKVYGDPRIAAKVSRGNFSPPPSVDSAILVVKNISRKFFEDIDEVGFFTIIHSGFAAKRKLLTGNLAKIFGSKVEATNALLSCDIPDNARAENVPLQKWKCLAKRSVARGR